MSCAGKRGQSTVFLEQWIKGVSELLIVYLRLRFQVGFRSRQQPSQLAQQNCGNAPYRYDTTAAL